MDLKSLRNDIDKIDSELIKLFQERMELSAKVGMYKQENNLPIFSKEREREVLNSVTASVKPEIEGYAKTLYETIFNVSRSYQQKLAETNSKE